MNDSTVTLSWLVIREDDNGNRYRVGRYATRAEAQKIADSLDGSSDSVRTGRPWPTTDRVAGEHG
jgi:hypothetical protein